MPTLLAKHDKKTYSYQKQLKFLQVIWPAVKADVDLQRQFPVLVSFRSWQIVMILFVQFFSCLTLTHLPINLLSDMNAHAFIITCTWNDRTQILEVDLLAAESTNKSKSFSNANQSGKHSIACPITGEDIGFRFIGKMFFFLSLILSTLESWNSIVHILRVNSRDLIAIFQLWVKVEKGIQKSEQIWEISYTLCSRKHEKFSLKMNRLINDELTKPFATRLIAFGESRCPCTWQTIGCRNSKINELRPLTKMLTCFLLIYQKNDCWSNFLKESFSCTWKNTKTDTQRKWRELSRLTWQFIAIPTKTCNSEIDIEIKHFFLTDWLFFVILF